jgi:phage gp16-like protein
MATAHQSRAEKRAAGQRKAIHVLRRQLDLDRDAYENLLQYVAGVTSSTALDAAGREAVLNELRRRAGQQTRPYPGKPHNFESMAMPTTIAKIEAQLADMGLSWSYADAIARRMFGIARVAWCRKQDQLAAIVAALHVEQEKRSLSDAIDRLLADLAWPPERVVELLGPLRPHWRRHRDSLRLVCDYLATQVRQ